MNDMEIFFNFLLFMFFFIIVLCLAYFLSKYISKKGNQLMNGKNMKVIETLGFGMDKQIHLLKVGKKYLVVCVFAKSMQVLAQLDETDFEINPMDTVKKQEEKFSDLMKQYTGLFQRTKRDMGIVQDDDKVTIPIDKNLQRIKDLKNLLHTKDKVEDGYSDEEEKSSIH